MKKSSVLKVFLIITGLLLTFIGGAQLLLPVVMKAESGIDIAGNISVINDVRAANSLILALALLIISGAFVERLTFTSSLVAPLLFLAMGIGRVISLLVDGQPVDGLLGATILELVLGAVGVSLFFLFQREKQ
ncbi:MAG: DUF4345 domain-containing protein [Bacteroidota bacterium]